MSKRKFARLKGVSKRCDDYAQQHDRRPVIFRFTTEDGSAIELEGSVPPAMANKFVSIFRQIYKLTEML